MIIDCILDRKDDESLIEQGHETRYKLVDGRWVEVEIKYDAHEFYWSVMRYVGGCGSEWANAITRAMDAGTEEDVKRELCRYIIEADYNPEICDYINRREWLR